MSRRHIQWEGDRLILLDQRRLPTEEVFVTCRDADETARAITDMVVRGAPAIGITAAYGLALEARRLVERGADGPAAVTALEEAAARLRVARPTAVNLMWALDRLLGIVRSGGTPAELADRLAREAEAVDAEDLATCKAIGRHGAELLSQEATVLTHCNAGGLATAGYGTALGVVRAAVESGRTIRVLADETRPYLQGARLTAYELAADGIDVELLPDVAAGHYLSRGEIDAVVVGADRIAANGDTANKIGTYTVAVLAQAAGVPFYVAAPTSTVDLQTPDGAAIPIEERSADEVTAISGVRIAPEGVGARNPAFDVTPSHLIAGIITERGVVRPPYREGLARIMAK